MLRSTPARTDGKADILGRRQDMSVRRNFRSAGAEESAASVLTKRAMVPRDEECPRRIRALEVLKLRIAERI